MAMPGLQGEAPILGLCGEDQARGGGCTLGARPHQAQQASPAAPPLGSLAGCSSQTRAGQGPQPGFWPPPAPPTLATCLSASGPCLSLHKLLSFSGARSGCWAPLNTLPPSHQIPGLPGPSFHPAPPWASQWSPPNPAGTALEVSRSWSGQAHLPQGCQCLYTCGQSPQTSAGWAQQRLGRASQPEFPPLSPQAPPRVGTGRC